MKILIAEDDPELARQTQDWLREAGHETVWVKAGYEALSRWFAQDGQQAQWVLRAVMMGVIALALVWNWNQVDQSHDWSTRQRSEEILALVEPNAIVLGWWDTVPGLQYLQLVEGQRPDVLAINRFLISGDDMYQLISENAAHRPIYINNPPVEFLQTWHVEPVGSLYRLYP